MSNIICKTVGIAGMSAAIYDASYMAEHHSSVQKEELSADVFEKAIAAKRSTSNESRLQGAMQKKIAHLRMDNPVIPMLGKVKGFIVGFFSGLGDNIVPISLSTLALATKGLLQKSGAIGLGIYGLYQVAKEGFGMGKSTPVDD